MGKGSAKKLPNKEIIYHWKARLKCVSGYADHLPPSVTYRGQIGA